ncbi:hypothetical protein GJV11_20785 [Enterobacteriaceae bacterium RIT693]|jgi:hypothetical protein|nr:hypothetical protein [Enterobacteriaceae bacterium RIT693]
MKILQPIALLFLAMAASPGFAVSVGEVTSMMHPGRSVLSKEISNNTDSARFVSVTVERISSPMEDGVVIRMDSKAELLSTPASLILPGHTKENFRFIYNGPRDNKERYYRLLWQDEPIAEHDTTSNRKQGLATTSAVIGTLLVVLPRQTTFDFKYQNGTVTNTGNASFRVIAYGPCSEKNKDIGKGCRERYYLKPGVNVKIKYADIANKKTRIGIWHDEKFISVK